MPIIHETQWRDENRNLIIKVGDVVSWSNVDDTIEQGIVYAIDANALHVHGPFGQHYILEA
jgi:hypothetical protein